MAGSNKTLIERFTEKITVLDNGCWYWKAAVNTKDYGQFYNGKHQLNAHRWSYEYYKGAIPEGAVIDHLCRNRRCVNPDHLEAVTNKENILRGEWKAGQNSRKTHCKEGHPLEGENLIMRTSRHGRGCKTCMYAAAARYRKRMQRKRL